ncbi:MAG: hypothetical protein KIT09_11655 [Bryobacteraceae bacterium]|nr:hypothetical protein [Bryobacteraceae bacterium]
MGPSDPPPKFDYGKFLAWLEGYGHNFIRLWTWELTGWDTRGNQESRRHTVTPLAWARTGPGNALDGKLKFNLKKYDKEYFTRLKTRVAEAQRRGFYVSVMLFEGWGPQFSPGAWEAHPFHPKNNVNGIDSDANGDGSGVEVHELVKPEVTALQEAYVRKVIDTVNGFDNVLYEISNENHPESTAWQYHMIDFIHAYEKKKKKQHPVGMTFQYKGGNNQALFDSPADWISPNPDGGYRDDPPPADGKKVILNDTDHLWGIGGNQDWVWMSFLRGMNVLFMDPYDGLVLEKRTESEWEPVRRSLGYTLEYARRLDLAATAPRGELASSGYCLANPGRQYLVYAPKGGTVGVDLAAASGEIEVEWFDPSAGKKHAAPAAQGGAKREFTAPFEGAAVLYLAAR